MNFIEKISKKESDELVHLQFQKFSKGEFRNRAGIIAKNIKGKYTISTSPEFGNELVRIVAEKLGEEKTVVKGAIVSTVDLTGKLNFKDKKQFQGVKRYIIEDEMSGEEIISLLDEFPKAFFGLSFNVKKDDTSLKIKPKAPKSGKPPNKGEEKPKVNFCKIITLDEKLGKGFVFEKPDYKKAEITHTFLIDEIKIPEELKEEKDFALIREKSLRKGKIIRDAVIDEQKIRNEFEFEA
jgi:hypothetical protein